MFFFIPNRVVVRVYVYFPFEFSVWERINGLLSFLESACKLSGLYKYPSMMAGEKENGKRTT